MKYNRLYNDLSYLWPIISPPEEYREEAGYWRRALWDRLGHGRHNILELGVGGGHNLSHLTKDFRVDAVDISPRMLDLSLKLNPGVQHHLGDMRTLRLGRTFDAVLIHDAISCMLTESDLKATFATANSHLRPGGVFLTAPEWVRENFKDDSVFQWERASRHMEVTINEYLHDPDTYDGQVESIYSYVIRENGSVRIEQDIHVTGLFPISTWKRLMEESGFHVDIVSLPVNDGGYGGYLFAGVLPPK